MSRKKTKFIVGAFVVLILVGYLVYAGMKGSTLYYMTVSELKAKGAGIYEEGVRISGNVETGSVQWNPETLTLQFVMTDGNERVNAVYRGGMPDMFTEGGPVVIEGRYTSDGVFRATQLFAKCPSKYEPAERKERQ